MDNPLVYKGLSVSWCSWPESNRHELLTRRILSHKSLQPLSSLRLMLLCFPLLSIVLWFSKKLSA